MTLLEVQNSFRENSADRKVLLRIAEPHLLLQSFWNRGFFSVGSGYEY